MKLREHVKLLGIEFSNHAMHIIIIALSYYYNVNRVQTARTMTRLQSMVAAAYLCETHFEKSSNRDGKSGFLDGAFII